MNKFIRVCDPNSQLSIAKDRLFATKRVLVNRWDVNRGAERVYLVGGASVFVLSNPMLYFEDEFDVGWLRVDPIKESDLEFDKLHLVATINSITSMHLISVTDNNLTIENGLSLNSGTNRELSIVPSASPECLTILGAGFTLQSCEPEYFADYYHFVSI